MLGAEETGFLRGRRDFERRRPFALGEFTG
jgi:hypothetical protein